MNAIISSIHMDGGTQSREGIDQEYPDDPTVIPELKSLILRIEKLIKGREGK